jgi:hypothetical protein
MSLLMIETASWRVTAVALPLEQLGRAWALMAPGQAEQRRLPSAA